MFTLGKKLSALIALMCLVSLSGCPPLEDGTIPIGDPAGSEAESAREAPGEMSMGADCQCDDDETLCQAGCPESLICAALSCTHECEADGDCPEGFVCAGVAETDFDAQGMSNLSRRYCFES